MDGKLSEHGMRSIGPLIYGADDELAAWMNCQIAGGFSRGNGDRILGVLSEDGLGPRVIAAVSFGMRGPFNCEVSIAAINSLWARPENLKRLFEYAFIACNATRLTAMIPSTNDRSLRANLALGFSVEASLIGAAYDGSNLIITRMFRPDCKWIDQEPCDG